MAKPAGSEKAQISAAVRRGMPIAHRSFTTIVRLFNDLKWIEHLSVYWSSFPLQYVYITYVGTLRWASTCMFVSAAHNQINRRVQLASCTDASLSNGWPHIDSRRSLLDVSSGPTAPTVPQQLIKNWRSNLPKVPYLFHDIFSSEVAVGLRVHLCDYVDALGGRKYRRVPWTKFVPGGCRGISFGEVWTSCHMSAQNLQPLGFSNVFLPSSFPLGWPN